MARAAPAASRAVSIVTFLTANPLRAFRISELAGHLGMNIASAHATLAVLEDAGFVVRDPVHRTYVLGPALAATGTAALEQHPAIDAAIAQAELLADELGAEVGVSAVAGTDVILLARRAPRMVGSAIGYPGDRSPLLAPIGAVFLAWADAASVDAWLDRASVADPLASKYRVVLSGIRSQGFSVPLGAIESPAVVDAMLLLRGRPADDRAERDVARALHDADEILLSLDELAGSDVITYKSVVAPIFDPIGRVLLSLGVTGPDHPVAVDDVLALGRRVVRAAAVATRQARGRAPEPEPSLR